MKTAIEKLRYNRDDIQQHVVVWSRSANLESTYRRAIEAWNALDALVRAIDEDGPYPTPEQLEILQKPRSYWWIEDTCRDIPELLKMTGEVVP